MRLLSFIARCQKEALDKKSRTHLTTRTVFEVHGLLNKAIDIFNDWPERYYSFLSWCRSLNKKTKSGGGIIKDFGIFHHGINYQLTSPDFDFMRTSFQEYLITSWDGGYVRPNRYNEVLLDKRAYVSKEDARVKLAAEPAWIDSLISAGLLKIVGRMGIDVPLTLIEIKGVSELMSKFSHIKPIKVAGRTSHSSEGVDLMGAVNILKRCGVGVGEFVRCVLDGEITPCDESSRKGLDRFLYCKQHVFDYLRFRLRNFRGDYKNNFYVPEAAKLMGLSSQGTYFLVKVKLIASQPSVGDRRQHVLITRATIEHFNSIYISSAALAGELGVGPYYLVELLMSEKIEPVSGPKIDGGIQYVFKRADLMNVKEIVATHLPKIRYICRPEMHGSILIGLTQTAKILGLKKQAVVKLLENGVLPHTHCLLTDGRPEDAYIFNRIAVEKLGREQVDLTQLVLLSSAARMANVNYHSFLRKWVRPGKLRCIQLDSIPARRFILQKDLQALIEHLKRLTQEREAYLTAEDVAQLLGVHRATVLKWEKAGKLRRTSEYNVSGKASPLYSLRHIASVRRQISV